MAALLKTGDKAPDFVLKDNTGKEVKLHDYQGRKNVVLYFYPKDDTPGCTKEACNFRDNLSRFSSLDTQILGISVDNVESHRSFSEKFSLPFPLLADDNKAVCKEYGVLNEKGYAARVTYLIDKNGMIRRVFPEVKVDAHWEEVKNSIEGMKSAV